MFKSNINKKLINKVIAYEIAIPFSPSIKLKEFIKSQKHRIVNMYLKKLFSSYVESKKDMIILFNTISSFKYKKINIIKINDNDFK